MLKYLWSGRYREIPAITGQRCSGHRETLISRSRRIFGQLRVTCKVKRRLTLTSRNHKFKTTRKIQDDRLANIARNGRVFPWGVVVHDVVHKAFMNQITKYVVMMFVHEHDGQAFPP